MEEPPNPFLQFLGKDIANSIFLYIPKESLYNLLLTSKSIYNFINSNGYLRWEQLLFFDESDFNNIIRCLSIQRFSKLEKLQIKNIRFSPQQLIQIFSHINRCNILHLDIFHIGINGEIEEVIAKILKTNTIFNHLTFRCYKVQALGSQSIEGKFHFSYLDIHSDNLGITKRPSDMNFSNTIKTEKEKEIIKAAKMNINPNSLIISWNEITERGAKMIAEVLEVNTTLNSLIIWGRKITIEGRLTILKTMRFFSNENFEH